MSKNIAIILAAGKGLRMNSEISKPFLKLLDKPIIIHTIEKFYYHPEISGLIVVVNKDDKEKMNDLLFEQYKFSKDKIKIVIGGERRQDSVFNALKSCAQDTDIVLIHDGVRPFVHKDDILEMIKLVQEKNAVIIGIPAKDTIKVVDEGVVHSTPERKFLWQIFTPQIFKYDLILNAYKNLKAEHTITDDASLLEEMQEDVYVYQGSPDNIKITEPYDLKLAETIIRS
ncbi:MAG: 2-C-methyl-D-erythritol 4-phosphate cytidylyltransferase [Candidatus Cloacimonadota bacterium]|nr:MAG: 2-C-methyl-D-erythritol 4-phosphate cytidylyltransferase [Candidatus Cloacimonadota bacterium]